MTVYNDNFDGVNGSDPNPTQWDTYFDPYDGGSTASISIQNNALSNSLTQVSFPVTQSVSVLSGDFDTQVDFSANIGAIADWAYGLAIGEGTSSVFNDAKFAHISRYYGVSGPYRATTFNIAAVTGGAENSTGKFRLQRTGSSLALMYWNGSSWTTLLTDGAYGTHDVHVKLYVRSWGPGNSFDVSFDNFLTGTDIPDGINAYDITVDHTKVSENLTDFPLQVKLNSADHPKFFNELLVGGEIKPLRAKFEQNLPTAGPDLFVYDDGGVNYSVSPDGQTVTKTSGTSWTSIRATTGWNSGKHFWVTKIVSGSTNGIMVGVGTADHPLNNYISAAGTAQGWAYYANGDYRTPTGTVGSIMGVGTGHYIAIALDMDAGKIWFGYALSAETDIVWYGDPSAGTGDVLTGIPTDGTYLYPMLTIYYENEILESDSKDFGTFTVPTGFEPAGGPLEMTQLPAEVAYSSTTEAIYYTKVPTISASADTEITLSFDNTWSDNDYALGDLCIQSDTTDGSTSFVDSSKHSHVITPHGGIHHETDQKKIGASSIQPVRVSTTEGGYLTVPASPLLHLSDSDFTIDFWLYGQNLNESPILIAQGDYSDGAHTFDTSFQVRNLDGSGLTFLYTVDGSNYVTPVTGYTPTANQWAHIAIVRNGASLMFFGDGVLKHTHNIGSAVIYSSSKNLHFGGFYVESYFGEVWGTLDGYMDQIRITKGKAVWTENFTPPTTAYTAGYLGETGSEIAQTVWDDGFKGVWLMRQDPTVGGPCILDSTANKNHGTPVNMGVLDPAVGGLTFDGTGYITVPDHDSLDGYTSGMSLDLFLKQPTNSTQQAVFSKWVLNSGSAADDSYLFGLYQGAFEAYVNNSGTTVTVVNREGNIDDNTFRHLSYGWDVPTTTFYIDAVSYPTSSTMAFNLTAGSGSLDIGARNNNGSRDNKFVGVIGAAMLSNVTRSLAWISAMKENLHATLATFTEGEAPPAISYQPIIFIVS